MALTQQEIQEALGNLYRLLSQGAGSISVEGRTTTYRSSTEILEAIRFYEGMSEGTAGGSRKARFIQFAYKDD